LLLKEAIELVIFSFSSSTTSKLKSLLAAKNIFA